MPNLTHAPEPTKSATPARPATAAPLRPATPFFAPAPARRGAGGGRAPVGAAPARTPLAAAPGSAGPVGRPAPASAAERRPAGRQQAPNVVASTLEAALDWLPDVLREPATEYAHGFAGYPLLTVVLGYDPLAHRRVSRTPEALAKGLLRFSEQGTQLYEAVQKTGALAQAGQLIQREAARYHLDGPRLLRLLHELARRYDRYHLYEMVTNPDLLLHPLGELAADVWAFARAVAPPLLELALRALGPRGQQVLDLLHRGQTTFALIMANPRGFLVNLVGGVRLGFSQFAHNALRHLGNAFTTWLFGEVEGGLRLELPITGAGLFQFGLSVLNLGYAQLRQKLVKRLGPRGEQVLGILETAAGLVRTLVTEGPAAAGRELLDMARTALDGLKQQVLDGLREWLMQSLLLKGVQKLAMLLSPASALFETLLQTYNTVVFFLERAEKFQALLTTIVGAVSDIATGVLAPAANKVENTLARGLSLALDWLMRLVGLGNVPAKVRQHIEHARHWVDELVDKYLDKFIDMARKLWHQGKQAAAGAVGAVKGWLGLSEKFINPEGEQHTLFLEQSADGPHLMVASTPQALERYLIAARATATPRELNLINSAETARLELAKLAMYTVDLDEPSVAQNIKTLLTRISRLLALIGGETLKSLPLPADPGWKPTAGAAKRSEVQHVSSRTAHVGGNIQSTSPNGWDFIRRGGLSSGSYWVRMHMISDKLGGPPQDENLIPAPGAVNIGPVLTFETQAKDLITTSQKIPQPRRRRGAVPPAPSLPVAHADKSPTVLWITSQVTGFYGKGKAFILVSRNPDVYKEEDYGNEDFAKGIELQAGLVIYNPTQGSGTWERDDTVLIRANVAIPEPNWKKQDKPSIHFMSRASLVSITGCSAEFADLVKQTIKDPATGANIPYLNQANFKLRMQIHVGTPNFQDNLDKVLEALGANGAPKKLTLSTTV